MSDRKDKEDAKTEEDAEDAKYVAREKKTNVERLTRQSSILAKAKKEEPALTSNLTQRLNSKNGGTRKKRGTYKNRRRRKSRRKMNR